MAVLQYISFTGTNDCYGEVPAEVLGGASVFTIEAKITTTATANVSNYYRWGTIAGRDLSANWKDDWSLCVNDGKLCFWSQPSTHDSSYNYRTYSDATVNDGEVHEVAVVSNADGSIDLFCDKQKVAHQENVNAKITDAATMLLAYNSSNNSALAYQLYELRLWNIARAQEQIFATITGNENGLRAWYVPSGSEILVDKSNNGYDATLYGSPAYTEIDTLPLSLKYDIVSKIKNLEKTWIYGNAGTADLLSISGMTLTNLSAAQSKTGSAFYQTAWEKCFDIPATKDIWIKFDFYFDGTNRWRAYNGGENGTTGITTQTDGGLSFFANNANVSPNSANIAEVCKVNTLQTVLLHMVSDNLSGFVEAWIDGSFINRYVGDVNHGEPFADFYLQSDGVGTFFSNVIISNSEISLNTETINRTFDVKRVVQKKLEIPIDVSRKVLGSVPVKLFFDVKRNVVIKKNLAIDVLRKIYKTCEKIFDVRIASSISVLFAVDLERNVLNTVNLFPTDNTELFQGEDEIVMAKSVEGVIKVGADSGEDLSNLQSLEINISEQQLTDQVTFTSKQKFEIMQYIGGQYFDYHYKLRIESMAKQGLLYTCRCCSNIDQLLYEQTTPSETKTKTIEDDTQPQTTDTTEEEEPTGIEKIEADEQKLYETGQYYTLEEYVQIFAELDSLNAVCRISEYNDFVSSIAYTDLSGRTRADNLREIFGWTARIPHKMINVYVRDDTYFFVQRGCEEHVIDITETKHTEPFHNYELVRMFWGSTPYSETEIKEKILGWRGTGSDDDWDGGDDDTGDDDDDEKENPWTAAGTVTTTNSSGTTTTTYNYTADGVLTSAITTFQSNDDETQNFIETITYSYNSYSLLEKTTTTIMHPAAPEENRQTVITYGYITVEDGKTFLAHETTAEYEYNSIYGFELVDTTVITKSPTGRGQGGAVDSKGRGNASGNIGDDRVTPYQIRSAFNVANASNLQYLKRKETTTINGFLEVDSSFPLLFLYQRELVTDELKWLNRKTQETVTLNVYNFPHIIDFNDRIILDGEEYFVSSNSVKTTSRIYNEQSLTLVRWF